jgi:nucleotide-binding universal stress UspA family protein
VTVLAGAMLGGTIEPKLTLGADFLPGQAPFIDQSVFWKDIESGQAELGIRIRGLNEWLSGRRFSEDKEKNEKWDDELQETEDPSVEQEEETEQELPEDDWQQEEKTEQEQILIPVANPDTIEDLINLALVIRDTKQKKELIALNVINDNNNSENKELQGKRNLEKAAMIAASADVSVNMVSRYDLNIASGIIHTIKEYDATDVVIGLHRKANIVDSFFGNLAESLPKDEGINRNRFIN